MGQFEGILQTDGYAAYDQIGGPGSSARRSPGACQKIVFRSGAAKSTRPGCNSDCGADGRTVCRRRGSSPQSADYSARHTRRQETARPLLDDIRSKFEAAQSVALPSSALSKACQYALTLWRKLTRFLEYPELELSNNLAENSMRPVALGRKNWIQSAAHRRDLRLRRFFRSWKAAAG